MLRENNKKSEKELLEFDSPGNFKLSPVVLPPKVKDLCKKIDEFYKDYPKQHKKQKPSDLIEGAFYAARPECRSNPDWMSQAANSLRDVLYPVFSPQVSSNNLLKLFKKYATDKNNISKIPNKAFVKTFINLDKVYSQLSDLTHHGTKINKKTSEKQYLNFSDDNFEKLLKDFSHILERAFTLQQLYIHTTIDLIVQKTKKKESIKQDLKIILNANIDARQYFYAKSEKQWLTWLWENGFFEILKNPQSEQISREYIIPELHYLTRMAAKVPSKVAKIILAIPVSLKTFNPEIITEFLRICAIIPTQYLAKIIPKIRDEKWIPLMDIFNRWGIFYKNILKKLIEAQDYENVLIFAEAILSVRSKEELEKISTTTFFENSPFYINELANTKVFEYLNNVGIPYKKRALELAMKVLTKIIRLGNKAEKDKIFAINEKLNLYDVDFFTLGLNSQKHLSYRDDLRELLALIKILVLQLFKEKQNKPQDIYRIYTKYIQNLPSSRTTWRFQLFVFSLNPEIFKNELKNAFFRIFETDCYHEIASGPEYEKTLREGFYILDEEDKREYVARVIQYFSKHADNKQEQQWRTNQGCRIISVITNFLTKEEHLKIAKSKLKIIPNYEPQPSIISSPQFEYISSRGPVTQEEFSHLTIEQIVEYLQTKWSPENLHKQNTSDDFFNPLNAEGMGDLLQKDISERLQNYVNNAYLFFKRDVLNAHYTYSFLIGIQEAIKKKRQEASRIDWNGFINLCIAIKNSGETNTFKRMEQKRNSFNMWLAEWNAVHSAISDVIHELLNEQDGEIILDFLKYRDKLLEILSYLFSYRDPTPEDEQIETSKMKKKQPNSDDSIVEDPYTMAINSVRGQTFQSFLFFIYQDGRKFTVEDSIKISQDTKRIYETVLKNENTRAIMFMFGHHLPSFYNRDKKWIQELLPRIFPTHTNKNLYTAAWEGYLTNNLYEELFLDPHIQKLYEQGITLTDIDYPKQEHFRKPDEGIAVHFALAFMHYDNFKWGHPLFDDFWRKGDSKKHAYFIKSIGQIFILGENRKINEFFLKKPENKQRLKDLWDWMLNNYKDVNPFVEFGFWMDLRKNIFEPNWLAQHVKKTLEKTNGTLENWEYKPINPIVQLAKKAAKDTLEIIRLYLLEGSIRKNNNRAPLYIDENDEWFKALSILYKHPKTKSGTYALINDLIQDGGSIFWVLEKIIK
jgi:hypothetical protein